jgi:hypothetical protein
MIARIQNPPLDIAPTPQEQMQFLMKPPLNLSPVRQKSLADSNHKSYEKNKAVRIFLCSDIGLPSRKYN